jgi:hypothetical protein
MTKTTRFISVLAALSLTMGLAACSSSDDTKSPSTSKVTTTTDKVTDPKTSNPKTDPKTSDPKTSDSESPETDGTVPVATGGQAPSAKIPADFPKDVPLPDGKVASVFTDDQEAGASWTVAFSVADASKAACGKFLDEFEAAGFEESARTDVAGDLAGAYQNDNWVVYVGCNAKGDALALQVLPAS